MSDDPVWTLSDNDEDEDVAAAVGEEQKVHESNRTTANKRDPNNYSNGSGSSYLNRQHDLLKSQTPSKKQ